jgi:predicted RNase H-like nuclease (RuvC/YqgF family)
MNRTKFAVIVTLTLAFALSIVGIAQQKSATQGQKTEQQRGGSMQMGDMMAACREHCQATSNSIDQLNKTIDEAKRSNDPAKMRAALESVQKPLTDMKNHMSMCMSMMNMMQNMHGGTTEGEKNKAPEKK